MKFDPVKSVDEYERDMMEELRFDKYKLDDEFVGQPELFMKWARMHARAYAMKKEQEAEVDRVKAEAGIQIRKTIDGKYTEASLKEMVAKDREVIKAEVEYFRLVELATFLEYAVEAFRQRKELLKGEGMLWGDGYYSDVNVRERRDRSGARRDEMEERLSREEIPSKRRRGK